MVKSKHIAREAKNPAGTTREDTPKMSNFQKHLAAIRSGRITRSNIIGIRKAFNAFERARLSYSISCTSPQMTASEYSEAELAILKFHPTAVGELHDGGLEVLRNKRYARRWTPQQQRVIDGACRFDLDRFEFIDSTHCVPVFHVIARDGSHFTFRNVAWQSGGNGPEVIS